MSGEPVPRHRLTATTVDDAIDGIIQQAKRGPVKILAENGTVYQPDTGENFPARAAVARVMGLPYSATGTTDAYRAAPREE